MSQNAVAKENVNIANLGDWGEARSGEFVGIGMDKLPIRCDGAEHWVA